MWEMGIMEKWVEDFGRCEELIEEIFEKVILVIKNTELEKGSPLVQKQVEKGNFKTLMKGWRKSEKRTKEID